MITLNGNQLKALVGCCAKPSENWELRNVIIEGGDFLATDSFMAVSVFPLDLHGEGRLLFDEPMTVPDDLFYEKGGNGKLKLRKILSKDTVDFNDDGTIEAPWGSFELTPGVRSARIPQIKKLVDDSFRDEEVFSDRDGFDYDLTFIESVLKLFKAFKAEGTFFSYGGGVPVLRILGRRFQGKGCDLLSDSPWIRAIIMPRTRK